MNTLISYKDYLENGGLVIPEITSVDRANNLTTIEDKFNKWLIITQIELNYILQDKLEGVNYNLLDIDEPYRRDIINILVIRLNRAFENNQIIPRDGNIQYSEMGAINWSSTTEQNPYFWNLQELNIIEVSGLLEVVNLYCDEHISEKQYPSNLANEMYNRIIHDETLDIQKEVNKSNGLTSLNIKITDEIARKSEIPKIDELKEKVEVNSKNIVNLEKTKLNNDLFNTSIKQKVNKKTFNELSLQLNPESERHKALINKFKLKYKDTSQIKEWTFPNQESYNKVKKQKNDFDENLTWDDKNLKVSFIWSENQDFVIKTFAILNNKFLDKIDFTSLATQEDLAKKEDKDKYFSIYQGNKVQFGTKYELITFGSTPIYSQIPLSKLTDGSIITKKYVDGEIAKIKPPELSKAEFDKVIADVYTKINKQTLLGWLEVNFPANSDKMRYLIRENIKIFTYMDSAPYEIFPLTPRNFSNPGFYSTTTSGNDYAIEIQTYSYFGYSPDRNQVQVYKEYIKNGSFSHKFYTMNVQSVYALMTQYQKEQYEKN